MQRLQPMQNSDFGSKIKIPKNMSKCILHIIQSCFVQKIAPRNIKQPRLKKHCDWSNRVHYNSTVHAAYVTRVHQLSTYARNCVSSDIFPKKSYKIFEDPIMAEQLPCFQPSYDFLNVENSDHVYFTKEINLFLVHC